MCSYFLVLGCFGPTDQCRSPLVFRTASMLKTNNMKLSVQDKKQVGVMKCSCHTKNKYLNFLASSKGMSAVGQLAYSHSKTRDSREVVCSRSRCPSTKQRSPCRRGTRGLSE
ncbi:hypothetical protein BpHYR1_006208 [Brachionus plicatilis]|uniref:Uncharacterized protein n=1 Tax=Brachionus plicatilis TaxID=10195 RepID=A0A3M7SLL0_BRAPC|nr:hypothetical protein BpHYR1_006208 [Brachionus plicatilis]